MQRNEYHSAYKRKRYAQRRELGLKLLGNACVMCGSIEDLEFDHVDAEQKTYDVMTQLYCYSLSRFLEELAKCQLLCQACHIQKTRREGDIPGGSGRRRIAKGGWQLPEHGLAGYGDGCRCEVCKLAKHEYRIATGESKGGPQRLDGVIEHGTRAGYQKELRRKLPPCKPCQMANAEATARLRNAKLA